MDEFEQKIHDFVDGSLHPVNSNQVFQGLKDAGMEVTIQEVREVMAVLAQRGFLIDAKLPSYFAVA